LKNRIQRNNDLTQAQNAAMGISYDFSYEPLQRPVNFQPLVQPTNNFAPPTMATMQQFQNMPPMIQRQQTPLPMRSVQPISAQNFFNAPPQIRPVYPMYPLGMGRGGYENPYIQQPPQNRKY